jgi:DNA-binding transcriptional regulator YiaG
MQLTPVVGIQNEIYSAWGADMYHYRECGLPNVYLVNGYREAEMPYGRGVSIEDVEGLHMAIAQALIEEKPSLSGLEVRFIRKLLELTQTQLAQMLGVEDQSVRRWEKLGLCLSRLTMASD